MLNPGDKLRGSYEILGPLGHGASGDVFKARHVHMGHYVAIKMLQQPPADPQEWPGLQSQFLAEALLLRDHSHANLPAVTDFFEERQTAFMVMDFIEGENLETIVQREGPVPEATVLEWARQICSVLHHLHHELPTPIIHRDLKPQNLILSKGRIFVVDFGIAKVGGASAPTKTILRSRGTPGYCPLEQYHGGTSPRSDYYALGATMLHLLTGIVPPEASERVTHHAPLPVPPTPVSTRTWVAIQGLMEVQPDDRPATVAEVRRLLVTKTVPSTAPRATPGQVVPPSVTDPTQPVQVIAPPPPPPPRPGKPGRTAAATLRIAIAIAFVIVLVIAGMFVLVPRVGTSTGEPPLPGTPVTAAPPPTIRETEPPLPGTSGAEPPLSTARTGRPTSAGMRTSDPPLPGTQREFSGDTRTSPPPSDKYSLPGTPVR